jgi:hypothetical protein
MPPFAFATPVTAGTSSDDDAGEDLLDLIEEKNR